MRRRTAIGQENLDAATLTLGDEFQNATCLMHQEVLMLLEARKVNGERIGDLSLKPYVQWYKLTVGRLKKFMNM